MRAPGAPASQPARRGRPGHDLTAVLDAAVSVFNERGFEGASMQDVAARLGVGKSALYHHVSGKEELLGRALDHALVGLEEAADQVRKTAGVPVDRLELLLRRSVEVLVQRLPYVTLLLRVRGNTPVEQAALTRRRRLDRLTAEMVGQAVGDGGLRAGLDPKLTARLLFGTVNSLVEWLHPGDQRPADELADELVRLLFDGIRPLNRPARPSGQDRGTG